MLPRGTVWVLREGVCLMTRPRAAFCVLPLALLLAACEINFDRQERPVNSLPVSVEAGKAEIARVELHMKVGDLRIKGGSANLISGDLRYSEPDKPTVQVNNSSFRASVVVDQVLTGHTTKKGDNLRWDLKLNDQMPIDLSMDFGVGQGQLDLGSVDLRSLEVRMGVGELNVDLRGTPKHDYSVNVRGGVGHAKIYLPANAGIVVDASGGIGGINVRGLEKRDGRYFSKTYGKAKATIRVDVKGGVGEVELIAE